MKNITLNVIGQRILTDILEEKKNILRMNIFFFENLDDYLNSIKEKVINNIIVIHLSNFKIIEQSDHKIVNPIFYLANKKDYISTKTKFQKYELIYYPLNLKNFIEKIKLSCVKAKFADNSKVDFLNYQINLNTREIICGKNKLKLTEREKDFLLFLKNSKKPQTIKNILQSVWGYSKGIETHTVETHVHRLRKKFLNSFNDNNFIKHDNKGYYI